MIKATIQTDSWQKNIISIIIQGHSYKKSAQEIEPICAVVSAVVLGVVNNIQNDSLLQKYTEIIMKDGYVQLINKTKHKMINIIFKTMLFQIETAQKYFQKGIKITYAKKD